MKQRRQNDASEQVNEEFRTVTKEAHCYLLTIREGKYEKMFKNAGLLGRKIHIMTVWMHCLQVMPQLRRRAHKLNEAKHSKNGAELVYEGFHHAFINWQKCFQK